MIKTNTIFVSWKYLLTLVLLVSTHIAQANTVIYEDASLVSGNDETHIGYLNKSVNFNQAGTYQATLSDFDFPSSFDMLGLTVTSSTEKMGQIWNSGSFNFNADAGKYFLGLVYKTDETLNVGMYGIKLSYLDHPGASAVPLPSALWLMLTGVMAIAGYRRKMS
ncbi:MAG TPA: hypothetical protein ENI98_03885 [Gammaproteobacteria bacterium]|nr:hypothetical protein [Gammaproteobacteria bacterium]